MHDHPHTHAHTRTHTRTHTRARTRTHTQARARTHTHTHAHTRTRPPTEPTYARHMILHIKFDANMWFDLRRQYNASVRLTFVTPELKFNYYGCMYQSAGWHLSIVSVRRCWLNVYTCYDTVKKRVCIRSKWSFIVWLQLSRAFICVTATATK